MPVSPPTAIEVKRSKGKGRGVFATRLIEEGEVIERAPVLVFHEDEMYGSDLGRYVFGWGPHHVGLVLGYGSLYNHSYKPNACFADIGQRVKVFSALRDIPAGEEITINYNGPLDDKSDVGFEVLK